MKRIEVELTDREYAELSIKARKMKMGAGSALKTIALFFAKGCTHTNFFHQGVPTPPAADASATEQKVAAG